MIWIYPGSFDPITRGHMDIIVRASKLCEELVVVVLPNQAKQATITIQQKAELIERCVEPLGNVRAQYAFGLTIDFAREVGAQGIVRGIRNGTDFDYEYQVASIYADLAPEVETVFLATSPKFSYISSTLVRELASVGAEFDQYVPGEIYQEMKAIYSPQGGTNV